MLPAWSVPTEAGSIAEIRFTERSDGDFAVGGDVDTLAARRHAVVDAPWNWLRQVHGAEAVEATGPGSCQGIEADALVTSQPGTPISVQAADCAPVVLVGPERIGVAHAGWRGLVAGVLERAVDALGEDPQKVRAHLGPLIRPAHYAFGAAELRGLAADFGPTVQSSTATGAPALDLAALVTETLRRSGVDQLVDHGHDTADPRFFSHRIRSEAGRHCAVVWLRAA